MSLIINPIAVCANCLDLYGDHVGNEKCLWDYTYFESLSCLNCAHQCVVYSMHRIELINGTRYVICYDCSYRYIVVSDETHGVQALPVTRR